MMETAATVFLTVVGHGLWGSALILGITALCIRMLSRGLPLNATTRHTLWGACLMGIVLLHGALLASALSPAGNGQAGASDFPVAVSTTNQVPVAGPLASFEGSEPARLSASSSDVQVVPLATVTESGTAGRLRSLELPALAGPFAVLLAIVWLVGATFGLWRLAVAASRVQILKSQSRGVSKEARARILDRVSPLRRSVEIAVASIGSPVAAGFRSPAVLMPETLLASGEQETFDQVALHEVAHIQRGDDWALLIQRIAEAVLWFNPAVRAVGAWLESEREAACDEWVVSATREPVSYARSLGRMIELRLVGAGMMAAPGLAAKESDIVTRVKSLLDQGANATSREFRGRAAVAIGLVALVGVLSVLSAPSIEIDWRDSKKGNAQLARLTDHPGMPPRAPVPPLAPAAPEAPPAPQAPDAPEAPRAPQAPEAPPAPPAEEPWPEPLPPLADRPATIDASEVPDTAAFPEVSAPLAGVPTPPVPLASVPVLAADPATSPSLALRAAPSEAALTVEGWLRFLKLANGIPSGGDRTRLLIDAAGRMPADQRVHASFLAAARSVPSSSNKKRLLTAYLQAQSPRGEAALDLIRTAVTISGSSDRSRMLIAISQGVEQTSQIRSALLRAIDSLPSSGDRERALRGLTN